jgi:hypothetical protein
MKTEMDSNSIAANVSDLITAYIRPDELDALSVLREDGKSTSPLFVSIVKRIVDRANSAIEAGYVEAV